MKIFLDTANLDELKRAVDWGIVDGVTTNPSLIAKEGRPIEEQITKNLRYCRRRYQRGSGRHRCGRDDYRKAADWRRFTRMSS